MQVAGRPSWRLSVGDDPMLSATLWIRDAAGMVVDADDDVPPSLAVPPPPSDVLAGEDTSAIGRDWLGWWRTLMAQRVDAHRNPASHGIGADWRRWARDDLARRTAVGGPDDEFAALAGTPALQRACRELFRDASRARTRPRLESIPWTVCKRVVDDVATAHHVDPDVLDGTVIVLPTGAGWWRVIAAGVVLASDDAEPQHVLRAAFESAL
ncbi:hypothetical protein Xcel_1381 [Xylanimonas cellulosilytica DSM 15894]|uniref:Uncharacterized protein n=1 Tax=Xylanimonas cellulosilytica (strain DSM 15894 / JCM 12276 / CECT 5975 / KCTC 9989 / LMG 20990 / NBRC 107835 / XIL07) TaxID=446471 RepID=D1BRF7_XYLCX|nr:hypothetical protein [Xylanimonas cellulosilytica]ACZ30412.1 hypothetical protein Xcel_1381 [Xylanimonas cellulosilytica DSM 15894]